MVLSSVGGLSEISLLPFHHLKINNNNNHHFLSIGFCQQQSLQLQTTQKKKKKNWNGNRNNGNGFFIFCCSTEISDDFSTSNDTSMESSTTMETPTEATTTATSPAPLQRKRIRYRKEYPGEGKGIVEEMRFVAMKLHNNKTRTNNDEDKGQEESNDEGETLEEASSSSSDKDGDGDAETWQPSIEGFLKYLVDSKLVFETLERIVDESDNIAYTYFRNTGLERSAGLAKDIEWFHQQNNVIPEPSNCGVGYAGYLEELAARSAPMFLCHFYNIYFAHISGGQMIAKQVAEKVLEGRDLEFNTWEGDALTLLANVRENINNLGEHWTRDEKNKCLKEAAKSFRYLGQIVRLIIL